MRLIDADALTKLLKECQQLDWNHNIAPISWNHAFNNFIYIIDDEPTIEAEPTKRGKWIEKWFGYGYKIRCSECGYLFSQMTNYCPNCGAKMEKNV